MSAARRRAAAALPAVQAGAAMGTAAGTAAMTAAGTAAGTAAETEPGRRLEPGSGWRPARH